MRALTVQQPWAWAIVHGGKDVENRVQAWSYRGPLAIHAGARISDRGLESPLVQEAAQRVDPARPVVLPFNGRVWHPRPLDEPIPAKGRLGLWTPDVELLDRIREQVPA